MTTKGKEKKATLITSMNFLQSREKEEKRKKKEVEKQERRQRERAKASKKKGGGDALPPNRGGREECFTVYD